MAGSSSLVLSLLELDDESPALLFFLRLFLGFLFRAFDFATAGADVDAAGGMAADILTRLDVPEFLLLVPMKLYLEVVAD